MRPALQNDDLARLLMNVRNEGVTDERVLNAIENTPRPLFLPDAFKDRAFENLALPIGHQQTISQPTIVGLMTQALDVNDRMKVLEVGTGSGYQTAILAGLCRRVYSMERHPKLLTKANQRLKSLNHVNVTTLAADGSNGWPEQAPFQRIMVTAAAADIPQVLLSQLSIDGIMVIPIGLDENDQHLVRVVRTETGAETLDLGPVRFVPLVAGMGGAVEPKL